MRFLIPLILSTLAATAAPYAGGGQGPYPVPFDPSSQSLLNPPHIGPSQMRSGAHSIHLPVSPTSILNSGYMRIGGTNGIVRSLYIVPDLDNNKGLFQNPCQVGLRIYSDVGVITNLSGLVPAFDCPLGNMTLNKYRFTTNNAPTNNTPYAVVYSSAYFDVITTSSNTVYHTNITTLRLKLPVIFTNDCVFQLYDYTNNWAWSNGYFAASYELSPTALSFPYSNYRLRSTNYLGSPNTATTNTLIDLTNTTVGFLAGFTTQVLNITNADDGGFFDTFAPFFETGGSSIIWEPTGGDDLTLSTYALSATGQQLNWDWGIVDYWASPVDFTGKYATENYRWFLPEYLNWTAGLKVKFVPGTKIDQYVFTLFYYAP